MPENPYETVLRLNAQNSQYLDRVDRDMARALHTQYESARIEIQGIIDEYRRYAQQRYPRATEREIAMTLARNEALFQQISAREQALRSWILSTTPETWKQVMREGAAFAGDEIGLAARTTGINIGFSLAMVDFNSVEFGLEQALLKLGKSQAAIAVVLRDGLRIGLIQGESFDDLVKRLLAKDASVFSRGWVSAQLGAQRNVIYANNAGRDVVYRHWGQRIPGLMKQVVAVVDEGTTDCCLRVHGQVKRLNEDYELVGEPRFSDRIPYPPFHWRCRSSSVAYMPEWEIDSRITTEMMRNAAAAELAAREDGSREEIHPAHATSRRS